MYNKLNIFRIYAKHKSISSFWVGAYKTEDMWIKTTKEKLLLNYDVNITNDLSEGECIIADADSDYQHKVVSCSEQYKVQV